VVITHLAFLILAAMLLINLVMIKFNERDLVRAKLDSGRLLLQTLEQRVVHALEREQMAWMELEKDGSFQNDVNELLRTGEFTQALLVDERGIKVFATHSSRDLEKESLLLSRVALGERKSTIEFYGRTWGVIWLAPERVQLSSPVLSKGSLRGAVTVGADLRPLYQTIRTSEKVILIYVLLNTLVLVIFGLYLLSRTVLKPIRRLLRATEEFKEGEPLPALADPSPNEIGQLSRSLNMMLKRLEENKQDLQEHIVSLQKANEELKRAQAEIVKSEKLASIGRLAAGVAHEIGNPIGVVLGYLDILKGDDLTPAEMEDSLSRIESEINRINEIIRQLLDFSRPASGEPRSTSLHELVQQTLEMLRPHAMMTDIQVVQALEAPRDLIWADPNQIKQVLLNIIMNAADAMGEARNSQRHGKSNTLTVATANNNGFIEVSFADTGPGISPEKIDQIFDPFYTTKEPGRGTGLGLSVSYKIIEEAGGTIGVESTVGKGTTFFVRIPLQSPGEPGQH
jgi:signal transduction histidine kinase